MTEEEGETAGSVSGGYEHLATQLHEQSQHFASISGWMTEAASKVDATKRHIRQLARSGTQEIRDALDSELKGTQVDPSSNDLTSRYRGDIASVASKLGVDLDNIGHSLLGAQGAFSTPSYTRATPTPTAPTIQQAAHQEASGQAPEVTPHQLPPMPRATPAPTTESPSGAGTSSTPASSAPHSTLANLIGGGQGAPTGTPTTGSPGGTSAMHTPSASASSPQAHQSTEQRQASKPTGLPHIPSLPLDGLPAAAAESITTAVTSAAAHQLPTAPSNTITPSVPVSTGFTPGVPGTPPVTPVTPTPLTPIGGGGLATPTVTQPATSAPQATPAAPPAASQQTPTRSPAADLGWIQRTYGLSPGVEVPKPESTPLPALFIAELPEPEALLHRALATLRQEFETSGWSQPLAVATIRKGFESKLVYVTSDDLSIHPHGVLLPAGMTPLDEMPNTPVAPELSGSIMVSEKLKALIPRGWEVEGLLSTLPADENSQSPKQYQELSEAGELLPCTVSRGRGDVTADEAMAVFARAALGSGGCSDLDVESVRLRSARWVGVQPSGYLEALRRWYLSDAAECMGLGAWDEAVYCSERYLGLVETKSQVA
ncbi:hypothetical protein P5V90_09445 [Mycobacteroides abscessus subsp. abscessus]|uniref:hypothetical protein n=1 Tax=Mycobacteroides abscessus TaxID=36809 RepID=UPI00266BCB84|nr:hypothetical protein [Mycobacteroides abscessus]MDO3167177.1 hypothetical protein [Mycobacteroides abscessus subsp. abscessus]